MQENVTITLQVSNKSGALASIILTASKIGLLYRRNLNQNKDENRFVLYFECVSKVTKTEMFSLFEGLPQIEKVEEIRFNSEHQETSSSILKPLQDNMNSVDVSNVSKTESQTSESKIESNTTPVINATTLLIAHDQINADALEIAEAGLAETLGLVAGILVKKAAQRTRHIGELFLLLSEELEESERPAFLSLVHGLETAVAD